MVADVPAARFDTDVLARSHDRPVVVDFWAPWCGPCRQLGPILERLAAEADGDWELAKVNVDHAQQLAARFGVQGIPAVMAFVDGQVVDQFTGARPEAYVRDWLGGVAPSGFDRAVAEARTLDGQARRDALEALFAERPDHVEVRLRLALAVVEDEVDRARELFAGCRDVPRELDGLSSKVGLALESAGVDLGALRAAVEADPADREARWQLAHALAGAEDYDGALEHLLALVVADRSFRDDGARKAMLRIFEAIGIRSPTSDKWRDRLAKVLF